MDAGAQLHSGREAERPTMWLMSDIEAVAFIATVALMVMLALVVASTRQVVALLAPDGGGDTEA
jgi:hypothetical protein